MKESYIIALDQGTTSSRAVLFNTDAHNVGMAQQEFTQYFPQPGWVEHAPQEIWDTQMRVFERLLVEQRIAPSSIAALAITNQRETTVVWDRHTGVPVCNALVWQDRRTADICEQLHKDGLEPYVKQHTGLCIDAYFSATKIHWILENIPGVRARAERGDVLFGTIDTWLVWKLTDGAVHATDYSNASRTMLFNIHDKKWDQTLLAALRVPQSMLPEVRPSAGSFGVYTYKGCRIPLMGIAGDQQAALYGQGCYSSGSVKNTYGTGCFLLMNTGDSAVKSTHGLLTTLACTAAGQPCYALEGGVFIAGAAIQWLRDGLKIIQSAAETDALAQQAGSINEVYVVPAFTGLGAPYWDMYARGAIFGLTRDTGQEHIVKATLESLAYQTRDVLDAMQQDTHIALHTLQVDGGAAANNYLMQFQADILGVSVQRPQVLESTARGAALLAGQALELWDVKELATQHEQATIFKPTMDQKQRQTLYAGWQKAVERSMGWVDH